MTATDPFPYNLYAWMLPADMVGKIEVYIEQGSFTDPQHLLKGFVIGFVFTFIRIVLNMIFFKPISYKALGEKKIVAPKPIPLLDKIFTAMVPPSESRLNGALEVCKLTKKEADKYFKAKRRIIAQNKKVWKFCEAMWRALLYSMMVGFGFHSTLEQPWFSDPWLETWIGWPHQTQPNQIYQYYALSMGVYLHLLMFQMIDTKRSDFWQQFVHHIVTLFLISLSWVTNFVRIGSLVLLVHDISDVPLEIAKVINYMKHNSSHARWATPGADIVFGLFTVIFLVSRLGFYPYFVLYNTLFVAKGAVNYHIDIPFPPIYYILNFMLLVLQALHIFWSYLILRMVYKLLILKKLEDIRSDDEGEWSDDEVQSDRKNK